jgi:hypothetical protein
MRRVAVIAAMVAALLAVAACGGGSSSSVTSSTASDPAAVTPPPTQKPSKAAQEQAKAERKVAGRAAPFVAPESDNSVPTFGNEADAPERRAVEASLKRYLQARASEDWAGACRGLAKATRQGFEKLARSAAGGCPSTLAALSKGADLSDPLTGSLLSLRINGDNAFALFYGPGRQQYFMPLLREAGVWKPTQVAAIAYPPGASG